MVALNKPQPDPMLINVNVYFPAGPERWRIPVVPVRGDLVKNHEGKIFAVTGRFFEINRIGLAVVPLDEAVARGIVDFVVATPDHETEKE
jgi:hypothetical protein